MEKSKELLTISNIEKKIDKLRSSIIYTQRQKDSVDDRFKPLPLSQNPSSNSINEEDKIKQILSKSIVVEDSNEGGLGKDFVDIAREYTKPKNRFLFGHTAQNFIFEDSILGAYAETIKNDIELKPLYDFITSFRFNFHTGRSAIKGKMREDFTEFAGSILAFRGALEWRNAGSPNFEAENKKQTLMDRIKR